MTSKTDGGVSVGSEPSSFVDTITALASSTDCEQGLSRRLCTVEAESSEASPERGSGRIFKLRSPLCVDWQARLAKAYKKSCCLCCSCCCTKFLPCLQIFVTMFILACLIIGLLPVSIVLYYPRHVPDGLRPEDLGIFNYEFVHFSSVDTILGRPVTIAGVHFNGTQAPTGCEDYILKDRVSTNFGAEIIVVHGHGSSSLRDEGGCSPLRFAVKPLLCAGFNVLAIDVRNHGHSSDAKPVTIGWQESEDVLSGIDWLLNERNATHSRIFLWGMSMGAATVGYAAAQDPNIRAAAMEAPPVSLGMVLSSWVGQALPVPQTIVNWLAWWTAFVYVDDPFGHDLLREARFINAKVFHSHGRDDQVVPFENAIALRAALLRRGKASHYQSYFHPGDHVSSWRYPQEYYPRLLQFFSQAALQPPQTAPGPTLSPSAADRRVAVQSIWPDASDQHHDSLGDGL